MGSVTNISPQVELGKFFDLVYGDQRGYAYSPTKNPDPENPVFSQYFFEWPSQRDELINHVLQKTSTSEVYYGVALFKEPAATKTAFGGTNYLWAEFDGTVPSSVDNIPEPAIKIQSSTDGHEHWYWQLDHFETDIKVIDNLCQRLAYHLGADIGTWNANRVLRPPGTVHHESQRTTAILRWVPQVHPTQSFKALPEIPIQLMSESDINHIPDPLDVIAKFIWDPEFTSLLRAKIYSKAKYEALPPEEKGPGVGQDRNAALTKLAHYCFEAQGRSGERISNAEVLSILWNADERWGKFKVRKDRKERLIAIINSTRAKHPVDPIEEAVASKRLQIYTYDEFINTELKLEWVVPNLIHKKGLIFLTGPSDVGKSQVSLRFAEKLAKGEKFFNWEPTRPMRTIFVSMEMPHEELHYIMDQMKFSKHDLLNENMLIMPLGYSIRLGNKASQAELAAVIEDYQPDGIIFDSFGMGISDDLNSEKIILEALDFVNRLLRNHYGAFVWFIHHYRKPQIGNKKPSKLEDLFGSAYIHNQLETCISLWPTGDAIQVDCLKLRLAPKFSPFKIKRKPGLDFDIVENSLATPGNGMPVFGDIEGIPDLPGGLEL